MDPKIEADAASALCVTNVVEIKRGGQKVVARCELSGGGSAVLKVIELDPSKPDLLERARREVAILERIDHPNVVKLLSGLEELGSPPIAVAWLEEELDGVDLRDRFARGGQWTWAETRTMALDIARGLEVMHGQRVVHRDLSTGNVRCRADGSFTVIDPGLGRHLEESTLTGIFQPGTPGYMTPEHVGARVIYASDVFAVGTLMFQALTEQLPIPNTGTMDAYLVAVRDAQAPSIATIRADLDPSAVDLVDRCLQRQSGRRFIDAADLVMAIEAT